MGSNTLAKVLPTTLFLLAVVLAPSGGLLTDETDIYRGQAPPLVTTSEHYHANRINENRVFRDSSLEYFRHFMPLSPSITRRYIPPDFDIPLELNEAVWNHMLRLQQSWRSGFKIQVERSGFFAPYMRNLLLEEGCPRDMVYLVLIESGFDPTVFSDAGAAGPWQFMVSTGKLYGLRITEWTDERLDIEKSTRAAARHLQDLYGEFESWPLMLASYNAGPGAVKKAIKNRGTNDFWKIAEHSDLKGETKAFVPRFYASLIIAKNPERFGFTNLDPMEDPRPVTLKAKPLTDLATIAKISGAPYEQIVNLNANYTFGCTPPDPGSWPVRVHEKYSAGLQEKLYALKPSERNQFERHLVRRGESVYSIARRYGVPYIIIMQANYLTSTRSIKQHKTLIIPKALTQSPLREEPEPEIEIPTTPSGLFIVKYTVGEGDNLWKIANKAGVEIDDICRWNKIKQDDYIHPGQTIIIFLEDHSLARKLTIEGNKNRNTALNGSQTTRVEFHTVKAGENLSTIAKKYGVSVNQLIGWNDLKDPYIIKPGQKLRIIR